VISASSSLVDVAFAVCTALHRAGTTAVMTGGSAATYYAPDAYQSDDVDFVITLRGDGEIAAAALRELGFEQTGDFYTHARSRFSLDFPPGPLQIGDDIVTTWSTIRRGRRREILHVLSPTDACRDRLAAFLFWNDFAGLEQGLAIQLARDDVDLAAIEQWCAREGHAAKYELFLQRVRAGR